MEAGEWQTSANSKIFTKLSIAVRRSEYKLPIFEGFSDLKEFSSGDVCSLHIDAELWNSVAVAMICKISGLEESMIYFHWNSSLKGAPTSLRHSLPGQDSHKPHFYEKRSKAQH